MSTFLIALYIGQMRAVISAITVRIEIGTFTEDPTLDMNNHTTCFNKYASLIVAYRF